MNSRMRKTAVAAAVSVATLFGVCAPAHADDGAPIGLGSASGVAGLPAGVAGVGSGWEMAASAYSLSGIDPMSSAMNMGVLGVAMSDDYAITSSLSETDLSAINTAEMARQARLAEEARRARAAAGAMGLALRKGAVPKAYEALIMDGIARYCPQLNPGILAAQIEAESGWNPTARSPVGALGIAQFMPATWASSGVDANGDGRKDPFDPADAIPSAAKYDCAVRDTVRKVGGDKDANMLAAYNAGPGAVLKYGGVPPYAETQAYVRKILAKASSMTVYTEGGAGAAGDASGCPVSAPANTIRDGARQYSINQICADSVAQARTPAAARAIKFALRNLGAPYSQPNRMGSFSFDCSSLVMRAYDAGGANTVSGGWAPNTTAIRAASFSTKIPFSSRRPGDLVFPFAGHVAMSLAHNLKVHTNRTGDVSHVNDMYSSAYYTVAIRG